MADILHDGTEFQKAVWSLVRQIPRGRVTTYGNIASALGKPGAALAVGNSLSKCPDDVRGHPA